MSFDDDADVPWADAIDELSRRGAMARRTAYLAAKEGRATVEIPPYAISPSAPEWAARWGDSAPPVGTVLRWTDIETNTVGIATCTGDDEWSVAGRLKGSEYTFSQVARLIANSPCGVAVDWREIPTVAARPAGDDAVKSWASQFIAEREVAKVNADAGTPTEGH